MYISDAAWTRYIELLRKVNNKAAQEMFSYLANHEWWVSNEAKSAAVDFAAGLATKYGEAAAEAVCEFYDSIAEKWAGTNILPAEPAPTATYGEVAKSVYGTMKTNNAETIAGSVGRLVKLAGVDTMMQNAIRDGAEWAWIPHGDTCAFCIMLASRGWQRASKKALKNGHAEHIHANCDCTYAVRYSSDQEVEGYDPDRYKRFYYNASGGTTNAKLNSMRRELYQENREKILAQKAEWYEKSKELNASAAEEMNVN